MKLVKAPPKPDYPILLPDDLVNFDAFIFGVPTRYGNFPVQWKVRGLQSSEWTFTKTLT